MKYTHIIGIDEVGRGPIAGPVTVGFVCIEAKRYSLFKRKECRGIKDSKKLSAIKREAWNREAKRMAREGLITYATVSVSAKEIDRRGISFAITTCIQKGLMRFPEQAYVLLDGGLKAPEHYTQKTIIKGDESEPVIALASIIAKVKRDAYMTRMDRIYPGYGFLNNAGYGTKEHYTGIKKQGVCALHRASFL